MPRQNSQRLPAPSLFVGPPSRNASNLDLEKAATNTSSNKAVPTSAIPGPNTPISQNPPSPHLSRHSTEIRGRHSHDGPRGRQPDAQAKEREIEGEGQGQRRQRRGTAVLDAHWAALQSTLSDIEISAGSEAHVFGAKHADALEELRRAQVELARAWDSGEVDGGKAGGDHLSSRESTKGKDDKSVKGKDEKGKEEEKGTKVEATTIADLDDAARRRDASDAYFAVVKQGVNDVVKRLEAVSSAMRAVEMQSREIWGEAESTTSLGSDSLAS